MGTKVSIFIHCLFYFYERIACRGVDSFGRGRSQLGLVCLDGMGSWFAFWRNGGGYLQDHLCVGWACGALRALHAQEGMQELRVLGLGDVVFSGSCFMQPPSTRVRGVCVLMHAERFELPASSV